MKKHTVCMVCKKNIKDLQGISLEYHVDESFREMWFCGWKHVAMWTRSMFEQTKGKS